jgi:hypothetical protein
MELADQPVALVVEAPVKGVIVIRVAGQLDRTTAHRLVQVLDSQLQFRTTEDQPGLAPPPPISNIVWLSTSPTLAV